MGRIGGQRAADSDEGNVAIMPLQFLVQEIGVKAATLECLADDGDTPSRPMNL